MYDLVIRGGTVVDGSGEAPREADVGIRDGLIATVGDIAERGREEIDAKGRLVTPGFVDIHTHYDCHVTWGSRLQPSSQHGVTTVVMGNCGVGMAPCRSDDRDKLVALMEGVEDIPEIVMTTGLPWNWESYPDYLDSLAGRAFDMDVAGQIPHAPLRLFVMGDRALDREPATPEDVARMADLARDAVAAGALGFSTSRSLNHKASDGTITPSYQAGADELAGIAKALGEQGEGVLQFISDFDDVEAEFDIVRRMVRESGRPLSLSLMQFHHVPDRWREVVARIEAANDEGLDIKGQVSGRPIGIMAGLEFSRHPFINCSTYRKLLPLPPAARLQELRRDEVRAAILSEFPGDAEPPFFNVFADLSCVYELGAEPDYEPRPETSIAARAAAAGKSPAEFAYDLQLANSADAVFFNPAVNYAGNSIGAVEELLNFEHTLLGLGDGGAHCGLICDASLTTYTLTRWVKSGFWPVEKAIRKMTRDTAHAVGLDDRGLIAPGMRADINVIDLDRLALPRPSIHYDLPNEGRRVGQDPTGYDATIVAGQVTYRQGEATGALPGRLVRGAQRAF